MATPATDGLLIYFLAFMSLSSQQSIYISKLRYILVKCKLVKLKLLHGFAIGSHARLLNHGYASVANYKRTIR